MDKWIIGKLIAALREGLTGEAGKLIKLNHKEIAETLSKELETYISPRSARHYITYLKPLCKDVDFKSPKRGRPPKLETSNTPSFPPLDHLLALEFSHISGRTMSDVYQQLKSQGLIKGSKSSFHAKIQNWLTPPPGSVTFPSTPNKRTDQYPFLSSYSLSVSATVLDITPDYLYQVYLIGYETSTGYLQIAPIKAINPDAQPKKRPRGRPIKLPEMGNYLYRKTHDEGPAVMYIPRSVLMDYLNKIILTIGLPIHDITLIDSPTIHISDTPDGQKLDIQPFNLVSVEKKRSLLEEYLNREVPSHDKIFELTQTRDGIEALNKKAIENVERERKKLQDEINLGVELKTANPIWPPIIKIEKQRIALAEAYKGKRLKFKRLTTFLRPQTKRIRLI